MSGWREAARLSTQGAWTTSDLALRIALADELLAVNVIVPHLADAADEQVRDVLDRRRAAPVRMKGRRSSERAAVDR
jgi:hypothetical protein